jgi:hypothetical protein
MEKKEVLPEKHCYPLEDDRGIQILLFVKNNPHKTLREYPEHKIYLFCLHCGTRKFPQNIWNNFTHVDVNRGESTITCKDNKCWEKLVPYFKSLNNLFYNAT